MGMAGGDRSSTAGLIQPRPGPSLVTVTSLSLLGVAAHPRWGSFPGSSLRPAPAEEEAGLSAAPSSDPPHGHCCGLAALARVHRGISLPESGCWTPACGDEEN